MSNWKKMFYILLCGVFFTLNAQENELPKVEEEVKAAESEVSEDKEESKKDAKRAKEEKKIEASAAKLKEKVEKTEAEFQAKKKELEDVEKELTAVNQARKTAEGDTEENATKSQELSEKREKLNEEIIKLSEERNGYARELAEIEHKKEMMAKAEKNQLLEDKFKRNFELLEQMKKQEHEKRVRAMKERKSLQKQLSEVRAKIRERTSAINSGNVKIKEISDKLILSVSTEDEKSLLTEKSSFVLQRTHIEKELDALKRREKTLVAKLAEKDEGYELADGTLNWSKVYDIENLQRVKPGTWHLSVIAKDSNNNQNKPEEINIKIDPKSDIPTINVINPKPGSRVPGNLMIVGTAYDDDAVSKVTFSLDSELEERVCNGTDFWNYDLDTTGLEDGIHKLTFAATDVNGIKCKPHVIQFVLDRKVPTIVLPTMTSGTVVSGKCKISGNAEDLNGIAGIYYSVDGRYSYTKVANGFGKRKCNWSFNLNPARELGSGTNIIWIKAVDKAGSEGFFPLTLIVDREAPNVGFHYPRVESKVGNCFELFGYAHDNVEIKKLVLKLSGPGFTTEELPMNFQRGNAMWNFPVNLKELSGDPSKVKSGRLDAEVIVTDVANNVVKKKLSLMVDTSAVDSMITLKSVENGDRFGDEIPVFGTISSAHVVTGALINLYNDKNELIMGNDVLTQHSLSAVLDVSELPEGNYTLEVIGKNEAMQDEPIRVKVGIDRSCPQFNINELSEKYAKKKYSKKLDVGFSVTKTGTIKKATYTLTNIAGDVLSQGDLKVKSVNNLHQMQPVALDVSDNKFEGVNLLRLSALDDTLKSAEITVPVVIDNTAPTVTDVAYNKDTGLMEDVVVTVSDNLILSSVEVTETSSINSTPNKMTISGNRDFQFPMKVKDDTGAFVSYNYEIKAKDIAGLEVVKKISIAFKNTTAESHTLSIKVNQKNRTELMGKAGLFLKSKKINPDSINGGFGFADSDVKSVNISTDTGVVINPTVVDETLGIFSFELSADVRKKFTVGDNRVIFKDSNGTLDELICQNDLLMPKAKTVWPPACIAFNSDITVYGVATDDSGITSVKASLDSLDEASFLPVSTEPIESIMNKKVVMAAAHMRDETQTIGDFVKENQVDLYPRGVMYSFAFPTDDLKEGEHTVYFKIEDKTGKTVTTKALITVDRTAPKVKLLAPEDGLSTNGTITLRGEAEDEFGVGCAVATLNDKKIVGTGKNIWNILYDLYERPEFNREDIKQIVPVEINIDVFDMAGNKNNIVSKVVLDVKNDVPEIIINSPAVDNQRYTTDAIRFEGVVFDDDGIDSLQYRLDFGRNEVGDAKTENDGWKGVILKENELPNWSVTMVPGYLPAGKHTLELRAFDKNFVQSDIKTVIFQIDLENPVITVIGPENGEYIKGTRLVNGKTYDPNGIAKVDVSTNNGWTFVPAEGGENWMFYLDSKTLPDGDLKFLIRAEDEVGSASYSFALFNIDNTPPEVSVLLPTDGMSINNQYTFIGRSKDNIALSNGMIRITSADSKNMFEGDERCNEDGYVPLNGLEAWTFDVDVKKWDFGKYHASVLFADMAGNLTEKSFDFFVEPRSDFPVVELDQPQSGQHLTGNVIEFYGTAYDDDGIEAVYLQIDNHPRVRAEGTKQWRYLEPSINLEPGLHKVIVVAQEKSTDPNRKGKYSMSISRNFFVDESGIIINITSNLNGDSIGYRPWFTGSAQFYERNLEMKMKREIQDRKYHELLKKHRDNPEVVPPKEEIVVTKFEVNSAMSRYIAENRIKAIYMSYDNGNSYKKNWGTPDEWRVRLQTQYMKNGSHMLQFKAVTESGKETLKYFKVNLDREVPTVVIDAPEENTALNGAVVVHGYANDNNDLEEVKVRLKRYDKNLGKMPKFIDGIYLWAQAFGGPIVSGGFGFSFFDNIVRLEGAFGWVPSESNLKDMGLAPGNAFYDSMFTPKLGWVNYRYEPRFPGFVAGGKLLAQVLDLPFEFFFGEDASNFSISLEIGAGFYWFSGFAAASDEINGTYYKTKHQNEGKGNIGYDPAIDGRVLAGFMYQLDFFKVHDYKFLKDFALYFENSFYFVASEVDSRLVPQFGFGLRNSIVTNKDK